MKFKLQTTGYFYKDEKYRKKLEKVGFEFINDKNYGYYKAGTLPTIEINSLEELEKFRNKFGELILMDDNIIEIYDDYRE